MLTSLIVIPVDALTDFVLRFGFAEVDATRDRFAPPFVRFTADPAVELIVN